MAPAIVDKLLGRESLKTEIQKLNEEIAFKERELVEVRRQRDIALDQSKYSGKVLESIGECFKIWKDRQEVVKDTTGVSPSWTTEISSQKQSKEESPVAVDKEPVSADTNTSTANLAWAYKQTYTDGIDRYWWYPGSTPLVPDFSNRYSNKVVHACAKCGFFLSSITTSFKEFMEAVDHVKQTWERHTCNSPQPQT